MQKWELCVCCELEKLDQPNVNQMASTPSSSFGRRRVRAVVDYCVGGRCLGFAWVIGAFLALCYTTAMVNFAFMTCEPLTII